MIWSSQAVPLRVGESASVTKTVSESDAYLFAGITGDFHPVHINDEFAKATQFGRRLVHGALSMGFLSAAATRLSEQAGSPGSVVHRYDVRFRKPVFFGDTLTATVTVAEIDPATRVVRLEARIVNQQGDVVTTGGAAMRLRQPVLGAAEEPA